MNIDKCKVYYNDNGNYVDMNAVYKEGYMEFETTHFSQYIITDEYYGVARPLHTVK